MLSTLPRATTTSFFNLTRHRHIFASSTRLALATPTTSTTTTTHQRPALFSTSPPSKMPFPTSDVNFDFSDSMGEVNPLLSDVLTSLLERNQKFASDLDRDHRELLKTLSKGQKPTVCWIGCSDSRVPEGSVCQTYPGEIFTIRNVANQWNEKDDSAAAALTFAIEALGVEDVIIVGHTSCGGVSAAIAGASSGPPAETAPSSLGRYLVPLTKHAYQIKQEATEELTPPAFVKKLTTENVKKQLDNLKASEVIQRNWTTGESTLVPGKVCKKVRLHGWVHDISTGKLHDLNVSVAPPS